jgi:hypothetical protein
VHCLVHLRVHALPQLLLQLVVLDYLSHTVKYSTI